MKITILTLFPEMFQGPFDYSIVKRAQEKKYVQIEFVNIRNFGIGKHKIVDDKPYGGGIGMVMRADVLIHAIQTAQDTSLTISEQKVVLMDTHGKSFAQHTAVSYAHLKHLILICGHYEGVDERVKQFIDEEISIGNFVVTGGELPAILIIDAVTRLVPGVLKEEATAQESFSHGLYDAQATKEFLEYPQYTRPEIVEGLSVPKVLLSGNHKEIIAWKQQNRIPLEKNSIKS